MINIKKDILYFETVYISVVISKLLDELKISIPESWRKELKKIKNGTFSSIEIVLKWNLEKYIPYKNINSTNEEILLQDTFLLLKSKILSRGSLLYHETKYRDKQEVIDYSLEIALQYFVAHLSASNPDFSERTSRAFFMSLRLKYKYAWEFNIFFITNFYNLQGDSLEINIIKNSIDIVNNRIEKKPEFNFFKEF